jgi:hypothetical protein
VLRCIGLSLRAKDPWTKRQHILEAERWLLLAELQAERPCARPLTALDSADGATMAEPPRRFPLGTPTRYPAATSSVTPVDNRSPKSTAARPRSRRGKRRCSRKTRRDGLPSTSHGCRSCLGRRITTDGPRMICTKWSTVGARCGRTGRSAVATVADRGGGKAEHGYCTEITNPLRSAATISPDWKPDSVSTAPL